MEITSFFLRDKGNSKAVASISFQDRVIEGFEVIQSKDGTNWVKGPMTKTEDGKVKNIHDIKETDWVQLKYLVLARYNMESITNSGSGNHPLK